MTTELAKVYDPRSVEQQTYELWRQKGSFNAEPDAGGRSFCIVIPPPNVTDRLHVGHALNNTLQDILIRQRRMRGDNTLWMPGTDHAGIATQTVVEKRILAEEGKRRTDFKREEFIARVQQWKDEFEVTILNQLQLMGCSCDWRRTRFTMDEVCAAAVRATFFKLFKDGLIYRGKRLVNWDPATQTVLADDEVEHEEVKGHFWYMQYPLVEPVTIGGERIEHVTVATTRPETMLGDTAVAMNPSDPRAKDLVGKQVRLPLVGRLIPIIADEHVVMSDPDSEDEKARFSTGFLKVTPAHDLDDYQIGLRHDLAQINVMAPDGTISDKYGWPDAVGTDAEQLLGMDRFEAREAVVEWFRQENLLEEVREYTHQVGHSYRSHVPIEPYLSDQWYIAVKKPISELAGKFGEGMIDGTDVPANSLAGLALQPVLDGRLRFVPKRYAGVYRSWLENLRDWPISRQLWWGHQIPIWTGQYEQFQATFNCSLDADGKPGKVSIDGVEVACFLRTEEDDTQHVYVSVPGGHESIEQQLEAAGLQRDPDVLDTWFSSALWPFSTLGWPEKTPELDTYYPGNVLCTAREIITLWVSRMVMMGQYCVGDIPFSDVFIHAMIQDGEGRKMSKSLGNGIDPLVVIDSHGADAMRFTLTSMTTQTQDVRMPVKPIKLPDGRTVNTSEKFDIGRNFCNKLWNASRFAMMNLEAAPTWSDIHPKKHLADRWILSRLSATIREVTAAIDSYRFNELADMIYHFMWDDFCDWYLEIAKVRINAGERAPKAVLAYVLDVLLRLLHPICPFITESIWQNLNEVVPNRGPGDFQAEPMLIRAQWPQADAAAIDEPAEQQFDTYREAVRNMRNIRAEHNIPPKNRVAISVGRTGAGFEVIQANKDLFEAQAAGDVTFVGEDYQPPADAASVGLSGGTTGYIEGAVDKQAELARLTKQSETLSKGIASIEAKLHNENFVTKAPPDVVKREHQRLASMQADLAGVKKLLEGLS